MTSLDRFNLKGKVILLTGGAGLYGRGLTRDLAEAGALSCIIAARNLDKLKAVADEENTHVGMDVAASHSIRVKSRPSSPASTTASWRSSATSTELIQFITPPR